MSRGEPTRARGEASERWKNYTEKRGGGMRRSRAEFSSSTISAAHGGSLDPSRENAPGLFAKHSETVRRKVPGHVPSPGYSCCSLSLNTNI